MGIYRPQKDYEVPNLDLLTCLFDSPYSLSEDSTPLHLWAHDTSYVYTKADIVRISRQIAYFLRYQLSIGASGSSEDVVLCCSANQPLLPTVFYGTIAAGGVYSAASSALTPEELARQVKDGPAKVIVCCEKTQETAKKAAQIVGLGLDKVLVLHSKNSPGGSVKDSLMSINGGPEGLGPGKSELDWRRITDKKLLSESCVLFLYSSGTTGVPKGVRLSHLNLVAQILLPIIKTVDLVTEAVQKGAPPPEPYDMRTLGHLPCAHIAGVASYLLSPPLASVKVYWMQRYSFKPFINFAKQHRITGLYTVPTIFNAMAKSPLVTDHFADLRAAYTGASVMDSELQKAANAKLGANVPGGTFIMQTWGLSETTGAVTRDRFDNKDDSGAIGPLIPNMEIRLVDDNGNDVTPGAPGEIIVNGPVVSRGYHNNPAANTSTYTSDGWLRTGDIAIAVHSKPPPKGNDWRIDDSEVRFYIVDRKKELLKYKGAQVAPTELEALLTSHEAVLEAAVIGIADPDDSSSDLPRAYVVPKTKGHQELREELKDFVAARVAPYKQLRGGVEFIDELPKNAIGKILRRELRDIAVKSMKRRARL